MEYTQSDYEERINRRAAGQQTDEDLRLIKQYEAEGFSTRDDSAGKQNAGDAPDAGETAHATQPGEVKPTKRATGRAGRADS